MKPGRKRIHPDNAAKCRAYRDRKRGGPPTIGKNAPREPGVEAYGERVCPACGGLIETVSKNGRPISPKNYRRRKFCANCAPKHARKRIYASVAAKCKAYRKRRVLKRLGIRHEIAPAKQEKTRQGDMPEWLKRRAV